ncbi:MAG: 3-deoxy-7-phosphoheptulonate synthase class II [Planctomycetota bacterium]
MSMQATTTDEPQSTIAGSAWEPASWRQKIAAQQVRYHDRDAVEQAERKLASLPPLVTSYEIEQLKSEIAEAQLGERLVLQGGDCAETLADCTADVITNKMKILLQMSLVLVHGLKKPVTRIGRIAGQYAKPRSSPMEKGVIDGAEVELPSYFGDRVNLAAFTPEAREPNPHLMVRGYQHAAMTLNFIRSLVDGGFADAHHPGHWDLGFTEHAGLTPERRSQYERLSETLRDGLAFMDALGGGKVDGLQRVEFFTSHEGLNLIYESAQTRRVPRRDGWYCLTTHLPWIGERTRQLDGAHVEYFRGIENPIGVKIGPKAEPKDVVGLLDVLNPSDEPGKIVLIARMGAENVGSRLRPIVEGIAASKRRVLWMSDPMHGNGIKTAGGIKTRSFDDILSEVEQSGEIHRGVGTVLGGVHFELTGEDVTECIGGAHGLGEDDLHQNYASPCDPRLNYQQSLELAFLLASSLRDRG